jgi:hypothetical protein
MPVASTTCRRIKSLAAVAVLSVACRAGAQTPPYATTSLRASVGSDVMPGWKVRTAHLYESFSGAWADLRIENKFAPAGRVQFHAEYYDATGRPCFTLRFSPERNREGIQGPFAKGQTRTLYSGAYYLSPAVESAEVRVFVIPEGQTAGGSAANLPSDGATDPPQLLSSTLIGETWEHIWLRHEVKVDSEPFADLLLARVGVTRDGDAQWEQMWPTGTGRVAAWFGDFLGHQRFRAAEQNGQRVPADVFVLVRAGISLRCVHRRAFPARDSQLIRERMETWSRPVVPPVATVLLTPTSPEYWSRPSAGYFEVSGIGAAEWPSLDTVRAPSEPSTPGVARDAPTEDFPPTTRPVTGPRPRNLIPPPGADSCP